MQELTDCKLGGTQARVIAIPGGDVRPPPSPIKIAVIDLERRIRREMERS